MPGHADAMPNDDSFQSATHLPVQSEGAGSDLRDLCSQFEELAAGSTEAPEITEFERLAHSASILAGVIKYLQLAHSNCLSLETAANMSRPTSHLPHTPEENFSFECCPFKGDVGSAFFKSNHTDVGDGEEDSSIHEPLTSFPFFPELPTELRLKIWKYAHPGPRVVEPGEEARWRCGEEFNRNIQIRTTYPPSLLHVNGEACREALKKYKLVRAFDLLAPFPRLTRAANRPNHASAKI